MNGRLAGPCLALLTFALIRGVPGAHAAGVAMDPWLNAPILGSNPLASARLGPSKTVKVFLLGEPDQVALRRFGGRTVTRAGRVHTAECPRAALSHLPGVPGLEGVMLARPVRLFMDVAIDSIHGRSLRALEAGGTWSGHTGAGVIVGIVDSGVDPTHGDFRHPDGTSRLQDYWDQSDTSGTLPAYGYGSVWSGNALTTLVRAWDPVGHGTHVAGIAAGDGSASQVDSLRYMFAGVAPEAAMVGVAVDLSFDTNILDAVRFVFDAADRAGLPAVVNLSLGSQFGPHDGRSPLEAGLDTLVGPGRIIVAAAGNEGEDRVHAELHVPSGGRDSASVFVGPYTPGLGLSFFAVDGFHSALDAYDVTVVTPGGTRFGPFVPEDAVMDTLTGEGTLFLDQELYPPEPEKNEIAVLLSNDDPNAPDGASALAAPPPATGEWWLVFADRKAAAGGGEIDLWLSLSSIRDIGGNEPYWKRAHDAGEEVAAPGTARGVLTVGSMNTKPCWPDSMGVMRCSTVSPVELTEPGRITFFSSRGPTQDGRQKPEISAPGFVIASARSAQITPDYAQFYSLSRTLQPDREHFVYTGTSMSAPQVTGAVALVLAEDASLDPTALRALLAGTARHDEHAPAPWNAASGYGKLDLAALLGTLVPVRPREVRVSTNPSGHPRLHWTGGDEAAFRLESLRPEGAWEARARFSGPGPHVWDEPRGAAHWTYRLWSTLRNGSVELWAEAQWTDAVLPMALPSPNPFRESCTLRLPRAPGAGTSGDVQIFDLVGRPVRRLVAGEAQLSVHWDGRDDRGQPVLPGVYWVRAQVGPYERSSRIVRLP